MTRQIIGHRFLDLDKNNEIVLIEEKERDFSSWTFDDVKRFYQRTSFPFYQLLVHSDTKDNYYLDLHWLIERGLNGREDLHRVLNQYTETDFPAQRTFDVRGVYSVDMIQWGFHPKPVKLGVHESIPIPEEDKQDYLLTKKGIDYKHFCDTSLVSVNGFIHPLVYGQEGIYIHYGYKTSLKAKEININALCFEHLGKIRTVDISSENLIKPNEDTDQTRQFYLKFEEENFLNKQIALVLGGYLHFVRPSKKMVTKTAKNVLKVDGEVFRYRRRIKEICKFLDFDKRLGMTKYDDGRWNNREIESLETLKSLLDLPQTFLVVFETESPLIFKERLLHPANYPRRYFSQTRPEGLIRLGDGRYPACLIKDDKNGFVISTPLNLTYRSFDDESETDNEPYVVDYKRTTIPPVIQEAREMKVMAIRTVDSEARNYEGRIAREDEEQTA